MAPQNLSQVFVINDVAMITAGTAFNTSAATANATKFGMWNVDGATYAVSQIENLKRVQFTQTTLSNIISSPIIDVNSIVRINYNGFASDVQTNPIQTWTPGSMTAGKNVMVRIALRTAPTNYQSYALPTDPNLDVVGSTSPSVGKKTFPLVGNFAAGRMIFNIEIPFASTTAAATACDYVRNAISANKTLDAILNYDALTTATLALTARHQGVEFDLIVQYSDGTGAVGTVAPTRFTPASNYAQVISDEKSQRARYGNFNRMYFPTAQVDFAQPGYKYDMWEIQYTHGHPSDTGIARANDVNTLKLYVGSSSTALAAAANFVTVFGTTLASLAIATDQEGITDLGVLQS
jgi:hypothetical protein